jgi:Tfp pilus assembly protein PilV
MNQTITQQTHSATPPAREAESGFTLIEATIAIFVTVVGLISMAGMFTMAMKTNASSRNMTTATTFAQERRHRLLRQDHSRGPRRHRA